MSPPGRIERLLPLAAAGVLLAIWWGLSLRLEPVLLLRGQRPEVPDSNLLLDDLLGARVELCTPGDYRERRNELMRYHEQCCPPLWMQVVRGVVHTLHNSLQYRAMRRACHCRIARPL